MKNPEAAQKELSKLDTIFDSTPIWQTEVSEFIRLRNVQYVICSHLCDSIWQSFFLQGGVPNGLGVSHFLDSVSKSLSALGGRSESAWRVLTLRAIEANDGSLIAPSQVESTAHRILEILRPLTDLSMSASLKEDLLTVTRKSVSLWEIARKDEAKFVIDRIPSLDDEKKWLAEDIRISENLAMPSDQEGLDILGIKPLCLFPAVLQVTPEGDNIIVQGSALFPSSHVCARGIVERKEQRVELARAEEELAKSILEVRSQVSRRASVTTVPRSPMGGKSLIAQNLESRY